MKKIFNILISLMFMFFSEQGYALRCGHRLIDEGDSKPKVNYLCGEPDYREIREIQFPSYCRDRSYYYDDSSYYRRRYRQYTPNYVICQYRTVDVWIYNFGPRKFMREIIFNKGVVKEINILDYGY